MSKITRRAGLSLVAAAAAALTIGAVGTTAEAQQGQFRLGPGPSAIPGFQTTQPFQPRVRTRPYFGPGSAPNPNVFGPGPTAPAPMTWSVAQRYFGPHFNPPPCRRTGNGPLYTNWQGVTILC